MRQAPRYLSCKSNARCDKRIDGIVGITGFAKYLAGVLT
jgi:hypothetical protein